MAFAVVRNLLLLIDPLLAKQIAKEGFSKKDVQNAKEWREFQLSGSTHN